MSKVLASSYDEVSKGKRAESAPLSPRPFVEGDPFLAKLQEIDRALHKFDRSPSMVVINGILSRLGPSYPVGSLRLRWLRTLGLYLRAQIIEVLSRISLTPKPQPKLQSPGRKRVQNLSPRIALRCVGLSLQL